MPTLTFRVNDKLAAEVRGRAEAERRTVSDLIRAALEAEKRDATAGNGGDAKMRMAVRDVSPV